MQWTPPFAFYVAQTSLQRRHIDDENISPRIIRVSRLIDAGDFEMTTTTATRQVGSVTIVDISGNIVFGKNLASLRNLVSNLLNKGHKQILLNLSDVDHFDSSGLGFLVSALTSVRRDGGELKLLNLTQKVHVMRFTKLSAIFDILDDEEAAVRSFRPSAAASA
jgi:anti-sigma B factor antagonist